MTFEQAAARQYRRHSFYAVFLVGPNGEREHVANTQRKSGSGLMQVIRSDRMQARLGAMPTMADARFKKFADRLEFTNGWRLEFGGTIRQEAE